MGIIPVSSESPEWVYPNLAQGAGGWVKCARGGLCYSVPGAAQECGRLHRCFTRCGSNSVVECQLPKLDVAGSIPVSRSLFSIA